VRTIDFLSGLYADCDDDLYLEIRTLPEVSQRWFRLSDPELWRWLRLKLSEKTNIYFGVGLRSRQGGTRNDVGAIPCVWTDIDFKAYASEADAKAAVHKALSFGWTYLVDSGGGYHAYAMLDEPVGPDEFDRIERINRGIARRIGGDLASTDAARILRVPGTLNFKYSPARPVKLAEYSGVGEVRYSLDELSMYEDLGEKGASPSELALEGKLNDLDDIKKCMLGCSFLQHCKADASSLSEPEWWAMISNLCGFRGGRNVIHEMSKPYPGYSARETDEKILHCLNAPPVGCAKVKESWNCNRSCGVTAPAGLAWRSPAPAGSESNPYSEIDQARKGLVAAAIPEWGWIKDYVDYAESLTDAPRVFHLFSALTALSTASPGVYMPGFGGERLRPNLWTVLLAPSSAFRKTTAIRIGQRILEQAGAYFMPAEFSQEQLVASLSANPNASFFFSEFGKTLASFSREYMAGTKDLLANLYDCPTHYERDLRKERFVIDNPYITMFGASSIDWILDKHVRKDLRGGFLARILWVPSTSKDFVMDGESEGDPATEGKLAEFLKDTRQLRNAKFSMQNLIPMRRALREELEETALKSEYAVELSAIYTRYQIYAAKLAVLFDLSMGSSGGNVSQQAWEHTTCCLRVLLSSVEDMFRQVPLHRDDVMYVEARTQLSLLHQQGMAWVPARELARRMHRPTNAVTRTLKELEEMELVATRVMDGAKTSIEAQMVVKV